MDETAVIQNFRKDRHDGREDAKDASTSGVRAVLAQYADPALRGKEVPGSVLQLKNTASHNEGGAKMSSALLLLLPDTETREIY